MYNAIKNFKTLILVDLCAKLAVNIAHKLADFGEKEMHEMYVLFHLHSNERIVHAVKEKIDSL